MVYYVKLSETNITKENIKQIENLAHDNGFDTNWVLSDIVNGKIKQKSFNYLSYNNNNNLVAVHTFIEFFKGNESKKVTLKELKQHILKGE